MLPGGQGTKGKGTYPGALLPHLGLTASWSANQLLLGSLSSSKLCITKTFQKQTSVGMTEKQSGLAPSHHHLNDTWAIEVHVPPSSRRLLKLVHP